MDERANRALGFLQEVAYTTENIKTVEDTKRFNRNDYKKQVWEPFEKY